MIEVNLNDDFIRRLEERANNPLPLTMELAESWVRLIQDKFFQEGVPRWRPLAPSTLKERKRKGYTGKILQRTSALLSSIQPFSNNEEAGAGTNLKYAAVHEKGADIFHPARPSKVRLRTNASGSLLRQKGYNNLAVFASKKHKRAVQKDITVKAYTVRIPPRPFISLNEADKEMFGNIIIRFFG